MTATIAAAVLAGAPYTPHSTAATPKLTTLIAEQQLATWRCQDQLGWPRTRASVTPWALPRSHAYRRWVLSLWTMRAGVCKAAQRELERQWNWQAWLPANWAAVARCETGINWAHSNSAYVSAFGIQRGGLGGQYDDDARKVGMPPWSDDPRRRPTPWQQWQTALSHYRSFGDGWECPGP